MKTRALSGLLLVLPLWAACNGTSTGNPMGETGKPPKGATLVKSNLSRETDPQVSETDSATLADGNRAFAFDLYRTLSQPGKNLFFSPFSVSAALAMTYAGARGNTEAEMRSTLHFDLGQNLVHPAFNATLQSLDRRGAELAPDSTGTGFELRIVNQAWGENGYPFLPTYLDVLATNYGAGLFTVNFSDSEATRTLINDWVKDQTEQRIKDLLPSGALSGDTRLVLTNAIYFKANWLQQFKPADTQDAVFHAASAERTVPMMHKTLDANYVEGDGFQAVALPYLSPTVQMLLILPSEGNFDSFVGGLDDATFSSIREGLNEATVTLSLPKFQFESKNKLKGALSSLGMPSAFGNADFSGIAGGIEELYIDEVYHKAFVGVDEQGTEAAAATAVVVTRESAKPLATLTLDRPFVFAIYDQPTGEVLFLGSLADPDAPPEE
ncbi:MAG TPA: serpin family protein [Polyangiaceae bacterium]|jgi:serpin B|nr:serpin family protein [Polyangiaceae bacterium]